jgi:hypothetical protein
MARRILISSTKNRNINYLITLHNNLKSSGSVIVPFRTPKDAQDADERIQETWI